MTLDYYAYRKKSMDDSALERQEPHLAYLWYEALNCRKKNRVRDSWQKSLSVKNSPWQETPFNFCQIPESFVSTPDISAIDWLPRFSFMLQLTFKIDKPYISKDEKSFYLLENPLRREKVFKTPMLAASSWKGALRAAMMQMLVQWWAGLDVSEKEKRSNRKRFVSWRLQLVRLFGTERGTSPDDKNYNHYLDRLGGKYQGRWFRRWLRRFASPTGFLAGRLHFYPTFFKEVALEVINPHDRKTGTSMCGPISLECVPEGAKGTFFILYVPFGRNEKNHREAVAQDLVFLAEGIRAVLTIYGFGAKTSSGFGVVKERLIGENRLLLKAELPSQNTENNLASQQSEKLPCYLEAPDRLIEDLRCPDGTLKEEDEYRQWLKNKGRKYSKRQKQLYNRAKSWWKRKQLEEKSLEEMTPKPQPKAEEALLVTEITFSTLDEFCSRIREAAAALCEGGAL